jgi:hypothetical protein
MAQRLELHVILESILGSENVYFQPPATIQMVYPCIVYRRDSIQTRFADDNPYSHKKRYQVTVIDRNPDSDIPDKVADLPMCSSERFYVADKLNHDVFNLFF